MDMMPMIWCVDQFHIMTFTHRCHSHQWDLGEFDQKGAIATRWGTKDQLTRACSIARQHGVGPVITAVLNVRHLEFVLDLIALLYYEQQKLGADTPERFMAVRVDPRNRLREIEKEKEISVCAFEHGAIRIPRCVHRDGPDSISPGDKER